jgi:4-hydroxy-tetrahydrodipicolinate synthase
MTGFRHPSEPTVFCMTVTPMDYDGRLDEEGMRCHLRRLIAANVGIYLGSGGSGEGHSLTHDELAAIYRWGVEECSGRVPLYCNPPETRTAEEMIAKCRLGQDAGVDLVQVYQLDAGHGRKPVVAEQARYYREVLDSVGHPVGLSIHRAAGYSTPTSLVVSLCQDYPQIKLVNVHLAPTMNYVIELMDQLPSGVKVYLGIDTMLGGLLMGAWGVQITEANQAPNLCRSVVDHYLAGRLAEAARAYANVLRVKAIIDSGRGVSSDGPKAALTALGIDVGPPRSPRVAVDDAIIAQMRSAFARMDLLNLERAAAQGVHDEH